MRLKHLAAAGVAALTFVATSAAAGPVFQFTNTTFTFNGAAAGTLTGTFETSDNLSSLLTYNITASAAASSAAFPFGGYTFTAASSTVSAATLPSQYFQLTSTLPLGPSLRIFFASPLTATGTTILSSASFESEFLSGNRLPTGTITSVTAAVPEPATWGMMILGMGAVGYVMRRRQKMSVSYAA